MVGGSFGQLAAAGSELGDGGAGVLDRETELRGAVRLAAPDQDRGHAVEVFEERANQGVAAAELGVQKRERAVLGRGRKPQGNLGQLDGHRVLVDAVDAAFDNQPAVGGALLVVDQVVGIQALGDAGPAVPSARKWTAGTRNAPEPMDGSITRSWRTSSLERPSTSGSSASRARNAAIARGV